MTVENVTPITQEDYIKQLLIQIRELELHNEYLKQVDDRPFDHQNAKSIQDGIGINNEQFFELNKAMMHWVQWMMNNKENPSTVFEKIYKSPMPLRERMLMSYLLGCHITGIISAINPTRPNGGGGIGR